MNALLAILPLSLSSGINLYLTILALGIAGRLEYLALPASMDFVTSTPVLAVAALLTLVEFFADKIPLVDSGWDVVHTFIRPVGALVLALNLVPADQPEVAAAAALLAGATALTAHSGKAGFRAMVNTSPEPVSNSVVSVAEDASVIGLVAMVAAFPLLALAAAAVMLVVIVIGLVFMLRWAGTMFDSVWAFFMGKPKRKPRYPPRRASGYRMR